MARTRFVHAGLKTDLHIRGICDQSRLVCFIGRAPRCEIGPAAGFLRMLVVLYYVPQKGRAPMVAIPFLGANGGRSVARRFLPTHALWPDLVRCSTGSQCPESCE